MSTKQRIMGTVLASLLLVAQAQAQAQYQTDNGDQTAAAASDQPAAPILHRRTSLPAGWFKKGRASGALTDTKVTEARPIVHFDTLGPSDDTSQGPATGAANRLRRIRKTVVLEQVPAGPAPSRTAPSGSGATSQRPTMSAADSTRESQSPSDTPTSDTATTDAGSPSDDRSATTKPARLEDNATGALPGIDQLPSVMKRPSSEPKGETAEAAPAHDRMKLIAVDPRDEKNVSANPVTPPPTVTVDRPDTLSDTPNATGVLLQNESPQLTVVTRGPSSMVVGKSATFVIDLSNQGDVLANDVTIRMNLPHWVEIVQKTPSTGVVSVQPDDSGNAVLSWRVDRLAGRGQENLQLDLVPRGSRPLDLSVTWTFSPARSVTQIQVQEPKLHLTVVGPQDVLFGDTKVYTIRVSNPGTGDAENVVLNLLPLVPGESATGIRSLGTIPAGGRQTIEVELTARQTGRLQVRAEVTGDGGLVARGQQHVLVRRGALEVQVDGPPMKYAGTRSRYSIRIANTGDAPASDVIVSANLPAGAKEVASSNGGGFDPNTGQIQWRVGVLRPGASRVYELECTLMSPGDNRIDLRSVAAGDLSALGSAVTHVESLADLKLTVDDPQGAIAVGADMVYEVRVINRGTKAAENIQLFGYFSEGIEPIGVAGWKGRLSKGEIVLQTIPRLGAGQKMLLRISARASHSGDHVFRAELECNEPKTKLAVEEWTRFYGEQSPTRQADRRRSAQGQPAPPQSLQVPR